MEQSVSVPPIPLELRKKKKGDEEERENAIDTERRGRDIHIEAEFDCPSKIFRFFGYSRIVFPVVVSVNVSDYLLIFIYITSFRRREAEYTIKGKEEERGGRQ